MESNIISANFGGYYKVRTDPAWLIDHGMQLAISGIDLPDEFECHFSNSRSVAAKRQIGSDGVVTIPDEYFLSNAAQIFCWIYLHPTVDSGVTEYEIVIPLRPRPNVDPAEPTQEQQDIVDQAIAALNVAMAETSADAESASASATAAQAAVDSVLNMTVSADTLPSGSDASVTKSVVDDAVHLAFGIPQGAQGVQGEQGVQGPTGATPNFTIGTVQTLLPTQDATATITGTAEAPVLNLGIPKGYSGDATNLAADYSSNKTYAVGEYCIYNGSLYRCTTPITTAEAWTAAHWTAAVLGDDVGDLKSAFDEEAVLDEIIFSNPGLKQYINTSGSTVSWDNPSTSSATYIKWAVVECEEGDAFVINGTGGNSDRLWAFANASKGIISKANSSASATNLELTAPENAKYLILNDESNKMSFIKTIKRVVDDAVGITADSIEANSVSKQKTDFIGIAPKNLCDLAEIETGILKSTIGAVVDSSVTNWITSDYIPVEPNAKYALYDSMGVNYGNAYTGVPYYSKEKQYMGRIIPDGGLSGAEKQDTVTIPDNSNVGYIRVSWPSSYKSNHKSWYKTMVVKTSWPSDMYIPYDGVVRLQGAGLMQEYAAPMNCLMGKTALWDGDSICAADNETYAGWAGRIAMANGMSYKNYAVAGGTIAENTGESVHSVCATLDTMLAAFPNADYVLIEGGTNDADILGDDGIGTFDDDDFSAEYIEALDTDTFSGALESIFYRLVTQMKGKHIGYIIPQKMGHTAELVARRRTYFDRAIDICKKWGIPYIDLWNGYYFNWELTAHWDSTMSTAENEAAGNLYIDGQHLTTTGYAIQSPVIAEWMKTI